MAAVRHQPRRRRAHEHAAEDAERIGRRLDAFAGPELEL